MDYTTLKTLSGINNSTFRTGKIVHLCLRPPSSCQLIIIVTGSEHLFEEAEVRDVLLTRVFSVDSLSPALDASDLILTRGTLDEEDEEADSDTDDIDHRGERWRRCSGEESSCFLPRCLLRSFLPREALPMQPVIGRDDVAPESAAVESSMYWVPGRLLNG